MNLFISRNLLFLLFFNVIFCFLLLLTPQVAHANTIYWEDNFHRANGAVGNGWTSIDGQAGQIVNNQLNVNGGGYAVLYNPTTTTLPANYYVTITFPNSTMNNNLWWGLMGRYLTKGNSYGSGNAIFWPASAYNKFGFNDGGITNNITPVVTGGIPASWSLNQSHTVTLQYIGNTVVVYLDGSEYGYFMDPQNNQTGTGVAFVGAGNTNYIISDIKVTDYLPGTSSAFTVATSNIATNSATLSWTTATASASTVNYGLTTSYGNTATDAAMVTNHSITLTGLTPGMIYHFQASSTDGSNNTYTSDDETVTTSPTSDEIQFESLGSSFTPIIEASAGATIQWIFGDGTTSNSTTPTATFGSALPRMNTLKVTPWSAVSEIDVGYDAIDNGPAFTVIPQLAEQNVVAIQNLNLVASYLQYWASNYNPISSFDFSNFTNLIDAECFGCQANSSINLTNTPVLSRSDFELDALTNYDLSQSPNIQDMRGADQHSINPNSQGSYTINLGTVGSLLWHLCVRDNPYITGLPDLTKLPKLLDLWIWNDNLTGTLHPTSTNLESVLAYGNKFSGANFSGDFPAGHNDGVDMHNNQLTSLDISNDPGLNSLTLNNNLLSQSVVDSTLETMDAYNTSSGTINLSSNNAPSDASHQAIVDLINRGWTLTLDHNITATSSSSLNTSGATITWHTDFQGSTKVKYGVTTSYDNSTTETDTSTRVLNHSTTISGLLPCTTYHYQAASIDGSANESDSTDNTFTTTGCTNSATVLSQTSSQIATSGGTLTLLDGSSHGLTLTVPASFTSASSSANFQAHQIDKTALVSLSTPTGDSLIGTYLYELEALTSDTTKISTFNNPLRISMSYASSDISGFDPSTLKIYRNDNGVWTQLTGCSVNTTTQVVTCTTNNFSVFGLFGQQNSTSSTTTSTTHATSSSNHVTPNANCHSGWVYCIDSGPKFIGLLSYISGTGEAFNALTFISNLAAPFDVHVVITELHPSDLLNDSIPFPWQQGFDSSNNFYQFQALSAFNGYPLLQFNSPVTIVLPYNQSRLMGHSTAKLKIAWYNTSTKEWTILTSPYIVNSTNKTIATTVKKYGNFVVIYPKTSNLHNKFVNQLLV